MDHKYGERSAWIEAARQVTATGEVRELCPQNLDGPLRAEWIPAKANDLAGPGEYRIWCPKCGAENLVRMASRKP